MKLPTQSQDRIQKIAALNDLCRRHRGENTVPCRIMRTQGIAALAPQDQIAIFKKVRTCNNFSKDNDPYGERNFGVFTHDGRKIFWKIDYYDPSLEHGSEDPADPSKTVRVLTIMLAHEY